MGQAITFHSYKGGTGRTMALANVATLLSNKNKVSMICWYSTISPAVRNHR